MSSSTLRPAPPAGGSALVYGAERIDRDQLGSAWSGSPTRWPPGASGRATRSPCSCPTSPDFAVAFLAITQLRAVAVPLNAQFKKAELAFCLRDCGVRAVLSRCGRRARLPGDRAARVALRRLRRGDRRPRAADRRARRAAAAPSLAGRDRRGPVLVGVHRTAEARAAHAAPAARRGRGYVAATGMSADDVVFCTIPLFHTYGLGCCLLAALRSGATLVLLDGRDPFALARERALALLERERVTVLPGGPAHLPAARRVAVGRRSVGRAAVPVGRQRVAAVHVRRLPARLRCPDPSAVRPD